MKNIFLLLVMLIVFSSCSREIRDADLVVGRGVNEDVSLVANTAAAQKPKLKYDFTLGKWRMSDDGVTFVDIYNPATGSGDVSGPASSTDSSIPLFSGTNGKLLKGSSVTVDANGRMSVTSDTFAPVQSTRTGTSNNLPRSAAKLKAQTSGEMVDGFGSVVTFAVEDATSGDLNIGEIGVSRDGSDNSGALVFRPYSGGVGAERMRIKNNGEIKITDSQNIVSNAASVPESYPAIKPSLVLDFANARSLDPRIEFHRPSVATRVNSRGLIETVGVNVPRFDFDPITGESLGLLIEEARTNLLTYSEQFDNAAWSKTASSVTANAATAPDGTMTADKATEDTASSIHSVSTASSYSFTSGTSYTFSVFAKFAGRAVVRLGFPNAAFSGGAVARFNLQTGGIDYTGNTLATGKVEYFPDGWLRISIAATASTSSSGTVSMSLYETLTGSITYTGDGTSGIYLWGAQLTTGAFPTSYIKTEGSTVTRAADLASMTGTNFSSWYRQDEGTFVAKAAIPAFNTTNGFVSASDGTNSNRVMLYGSSTAGGTGQMIVASGGSTVATLNTGAVLANVPFSIAGTYKLNDFAASKSGASAFVDLDGAVPVGVDRLYIGQSAIAASQNATISRISYYPKRLTNAELQAVTK